MLQKATSGRWTGPSMLLGEMSLRTDPSFWCVSSYFNPAGFERTAQNFTMFSQALRAAGGNLLTVELSFDGRYYLPPGPDIIRLRSGSPLWQKERLLSYAVSRLPRECEYVAWLDCDLIFPECDWVEQTIDKLQRADLIQLFSRIQRLGRPRGVGADDFSRPALLARVEGNAERWLAA